MHCNMLAMCLFHYSSSWSFLVLIGFAFASLFRRLCLEGYVLSVRLSLVQHHRAARATGRVDEPKVAILL